ncbi:MAG: arsenite methyltransferase [Alkalispirochaeta sp.]
MKHSEETVRAAVRQRYAATATEKTTGCCNGTGSGGETGGTGSGSCCNAGYDLSQLEMIPSGSELGLGCGNPTVAAAPRPGETVLDLGSGAGVDCFLAAEKVGPQGRVIGVDMTPEMVDRARANAQSGGYTHVEFRLGEIEALPVADASVDLIISNCVINLSPTKDRVFAEALRVLKPGGRLVVSDIVAERAPTEEERADMTLYSACVSGAEPVAEVHRLLTDAGFTDVAITQASTPFDWRNSGGRSTDGVVTVYSATIQGVRPLS